MDRDRDDSSAGILIVVGIILSLTAPIVATLIQLAISRKREFLADTSGALLTRYPEGLASALEKLKADNTPMRQATHATAHLWLDDPYNQSTKSPKQTSWFTKLFLTHPPLDERIRALRELHI